MELMKLNQAVEKASQDILLLLDCTYKPETDMDT
jgi:hypothetical protein